MDFQLDTPCPVAVIRVDVDLFEPARHVVCIEDGFVLIGQDARVTGVGREYPLDGARLCALEFARRGADGARGEARREREEGCVARVDHVRLGLERRARTGEVPRAEADETTFL